MPPSGYSAEQSQSIVEFLRSCASALEAEAAELRQPLTQALCRERDDVDRVLPSTGQEPFAGHVLRLTRDFYARVAEAAPVSAETYWNVVESVLEEVGRAILAVHVPPSGGAETLTP